MIYISRLKVRGFKSFKKAELVFDRGFVCIAGPNGSGKSNLIDALKFVFGDNRVRGMRVKKITQLISDFSKSAEVEVELVDNDKKIVIKRGISEDGSIYYKLNGKKTTRTTIQNLLAKYNIDNSGRNIIGQGEIKRLLFITPKERRQIIDNVVGISEYEAKKKDALKELDVVEQRINETNVLLGEKLANLEMLEKERRIALEYKKHKSNYTKAKYTLLKRQYDKYMNEYEEAVRNLSEISNKMKEINIIILDLEKEIRELESKKKNILEKIKEKDQNVLNTDIEKLKVEIKNNTKGLEEKKQILFKLNSEINNVLEEIEEQTKQIEHIDNQISSLKKDLEYCKKENLELGMFELSEKREELDKKEKELTQLLNKKISIEKDIEKLNSLIQEKQKFDYEEEVFIDKEGLEQEIQSLKNKISDLKRKSIELFKKEKEINKCLSELDKSLLDVRIKISEIKSSNPKFLHSKISDFLKDYVEKEKIRGFYGMLLDLISFDPSYSKAIEAAAGGRLLYFVVENMDLAIKLVEVLKRLKVGRATFIPLDRIRYPPEVNKGLGPLSSFLEYEPKIEPAIRFVFSDTILVENMAHAKKIGIGKYRMVTFDGEIFEKSGLLSGGNFKGILGASVINKLEKQENELKLKKESLTNELSELREKISELRKLRTDYELDLKTKELELENASKIYEKNEKYKNKMLEIKKEITNLRKEVLNKSNELKEIIDKIRGNEQEIEKLKRMIIKQEEEEKKKNLEKSKRYAELLSKITSLQEKEKSLFNQRQIRLESLSKLKNRLSELKKEKTDLKNTITKMLSDIELKKQELSKKSKQLSSTNKELNVYFKQMEEIDNKIVLISKKKSKLSLELEQMRKDESKFLIKKETSETRVKDISSELSSYASEEELNLSNEELETLIRKANEFFKSHENVNLSSIELYEIKYKEVGEVKEKISTLKEEKQSILNMINEIDKKKKSVFFEAFYEINDNFRNLFSKLGMGEAFLHLDKPSNPFEGGLYIKIKKNNKIRDIEILSGGEKTLTMLMFIFAMQYTKPSPYYIFDEVDESLDNKNIKYLANFVKEMSKDSQFIIISHRDIVLSFADRIYGISMKDGVSQVFSVSLSNFRDVNQRNNV